MLKEVFEATLLKEVRDIVVDFDTISEQSVLQPIEAAGRLVPLLKVCNTVIDFSSVQWCNVEVGKKFLPTIEVSFAANANFLQNDFPLTHDVVTLYVGNTLDTNFKTIKCDFLILSAEQNGSNVTVKGELNVPQLSDSAIKSWQNKTSMDVVKDVCQTIGLGLVTNIDATADTMTWLQCNERNDSFLQKHVIRHMWLGSNDKIVRVFVDAWYRLNIVDVLSEMTVTPLDDELSIVPATGEKLEKTQKLILNNDTNGPNTLAAVSGWNLKYSNVSMKTPSAVNMQSATFDMSNAAIEHKHVDATLIQQSTDKDLDVFADWSISTSLQIAKKDALHANMHDNFYEAATTFDWSQGMLDRAILSLTVPQTLNALYCYKTVNVELYNHGQRMQSPIPEKEERGKQNSGDDKQPLAVEQVRNKRLSGTYIITSITWQFTKSKMLSQIVECQRRMWPAFDVDKLK